MGAAARCGRGGRRPGDRPRLSGFGWQVCAGPTPARARTRTRRGPDLQDSARYTRLQAGGGLQCADPDLSGEAVGPGSPALAATGVVAENARLSQAPPDRLPRWRLLHTPRARPAARRRAWACSAGDRRRPRSEIGMAWKEVRRPGRDLAMSWRGGPPRTSSSPAERCGPPTEAARRDRWDAGALRGATTDVVHAAARDR